VVAASILRRGGESSPAGGPKRAVGPRESIYLPNLPIYGGIFCCLLGVGASLATVPFYVVQHFHGNKVDVGVVVATAAVATVLGRPVAGWVGDRRGYKPVMLGGAVICVLAGLAYLAAANLGELIVARVVNGLGEGTVYSAGAAWLVAICPPQRRGRVVGLYGIHMWLGITVGALLGTVVMRVSGFTAVWAACAAAGAAGWLVVLPKARPQLPAQPGSQVTLQSFFPVSTLVPGAALSLSAFGYAAVAAFVALDMAAHGVSNGIAALNAYGVAYVGVRLVIGHLPDRLGPHRVALWSALVEAAGLLLIAVARSLVVVVIGGLVTGAGLSLLFPALALLVISRTDSSGQGAALGAFSSFWDLGVAVGGPLAGVVASLAGYPAIFFVMAACAVASAALSLVGTRRAQPAAAGAATPPAGPGGPGIGSTARS